MITKVEGKIGRRYLIKRWELWGDSQMGASFPLPMRFVTETGIREAAEAAQAQYSSMYTNRTYTVWPIKGEVWEAT